MAPSTNMDEPQTPLTLQTTTSVESKRRNGNVVTPATELLVPAASANADLKQTTTTRTTLAVVTPAVTPAVTEADTDTDTETHKDSNEPPRLGARRSLFPSSVVTPLKESSKRKASKESEDDLLPPIAKRRLIFGKYVDLISCQPNVMSVYKIVRKLTGNLGGNGYCGPIYGELTMHSMQKMIDLMVEHTAFSDKSRFIDVGSGIGKPNLHVAQYPGVAFSCGVELEHTRWSLGMTCLKAVLGAAVEQPVEQPIVQDTTTTTSSAATASTSTSTTRIEGNTVFLHKNITEAKTFDPFTHVYMFSIGFPPPLWLELSEMWNKSQSEYLICYHAPRSIIGTYEFDVELLAQTQTSMHGSKEGHTGYIYQRTSSSSKTTKHLNPTTCDALFRKSWKLVQQGLQPLHQDVTKQVDETMGTGRSTRSRRQTQLTRS
jgi:hypothetical protein